MVDKIVLIRVETFTHSERGGSFMRDAVSLAGLDEWVPHDSDFALMMCTLDGQRLTGLCLDVGLAGLLDEARQAGQLAEPLELASERTPVWRKGWPGDWEDGEPVGPWVPTAAVL
jgi:hypothetical protein